MEGRDLQTIKPIHFFHTILLFGIPGLLSYIGFYFIVPSLLEKEYSLSFLFPFFLWIGIFPLFPLSIIFYKFEKKKNPKLNFFNRFRLRRLKKTDILWVICGVLMGFLFDFVIMDHVMKSMARIPSLSPPNYFPPLFNPLKELVIPPKEIIGFTLKGNWSFLITTIIIHTYMMFSEEIMWRGYILPRQEVRFGKFAWLVNGLLWAYLVHSMMKWAFVAFLPSMLITSFIAQKTKNTWVSLLVHGIPNSILWIIILIGVLG